MDPLTLSLQEKIRLAFQQQDASLSPSGRSSPEKIFKDDAMQENINLKSTEIEENNALPVEPSATTAGATDLNVSEAVAAAFASIRAKSSSSFSLETHKANNNNEPPTVDPVTTTTSKNDNTPHETTTTESKDHINPTRYFDTESSSTSPQHHISGNSSVSSHEGAMSISQLTNPTGQPNEQQQQNSSYHSEPHSNAPSPLSSVVSSPTSRAQSRNGCNSPFATIRGSSSPTRGLAMGSHFRSGNRADNVDRCALSPPRQHSGAPIWKTVNQFATTASSTSGRFSPTRSISSAYYYGSTNSIGRRREGSNGSINESPAHTTSVGQLQEQVDGQRDAMQRLVSELSATKCLLAAEQERAKSLASRIAKATRQRLDEDYRLIIRAMTDAHKKELVCLEAEVEALRDRQNKKLGSVKNKTRRPMLASPLRRVGGNSTGTREHMENGVYEPAAWKRKVAPGSQRMNVRGAVSHQHQQQQQNHQQQQGQQQQQHIHQRQSVPTPRGIQAGVHTPRPNNTPSPQHLKHSGTYMDMFEESRNGPIEDFINNNSNNNNNNNNNLSTNARPALDGVVGVITRILFDWVSMHGSQPRDNAHQSRVRRFLLGAGIMPQVFTLGQVDIILTRYGGRGGLSLVDFSEVLEELSLALEKEGTLRVTKKNTTGAQQQQHNVSALGVLYGLPRPATRMHLPMREHLEQKAPRVWKALCAACGSRD